MSQKRDRRETDEEPRGEPGSDRGTQGVATKSIVPHGSDADDNAPRLRLSTKRARIKRKLPFIHSWRSPEAAELSLRRLRSF